jgi:hypothetical protein
MDDNCGCIILILILVIAFMPRCSRNVSDIERNTQRINHLERRVDGLFNQQSTQATSSEFISEY